MDELCYNIVFWYTFLFFISFSFSVIHHGSSPIYWIRLRAYALQEVQLCMYGYSTNRTTLIRKPKSNGRSVQLYMHGYRIHRTILIWEPKSNGRLMYFTKAPLWITDLRLCWARWCTEGTSCSHDQNVATSTLWNETWYIIDRNVVFSISYVMSLVVIYGIYRSWLVLKGLKLVLIMTSSNGNIFRVSDHLYGEFTGHRWISRTKASDAELWCFLWSASE